MAAAACVNFSVSRIGIRNQRTRAACATEPVPTQTLSDLFDAIRADQQTIILAPPESRSVIASASRLADSFGGPVRRTVTLVPGLNTPA